MYLNSKISERKTLFFNLLISLFPVFFIAGNMLINIGIILLIISAFFCFGKKLFALKFHTLDKVLVGFFVLILVTGVINDYFYFTEITGWDNNFTTLKKSIFFLKYILIYIILRFLIEGKIINLKYFFISCTIFSLFVSFDVILQFINGKDIFGFEPIKNKFGGPFGNELIAGGYLQRFSFFAFFLIPLFYKDFNKYLKVLIPIFFLIFFIAIVLSGNRMPLVLFVFLIFLTIVFQKQSRKYLLPFFVTFSLVFFVIVKQSSVVKDNFWSFYVQISKSTEIIVKKDKFVKGKTNIFCSL